MELGNVPHELDSGEVYGSNGVDISFLRLTTGRVLPQTMDLKQ